MILDWNFQHKGLTILIRKYIKYDTYVINTKGGLAYKKQASPRYGKLC